MKRLLSILLCISLLLVCPAAVAAETDVIAISCADDMALLSAHPNGSFVLTDDIDMRGVDWTPVPFSGTLDGSGHTIYNLTVRAPGGDVETTYDGNRKKYETVFAGLFSVLSDAKILDLHLVNAVADIETDRHCFIGTLAGFAQNSEITGCSVQARHHLTVSSINAGIGGLVGFSLINEISDCAVDAELVFTDVNPDALCEEFLGGIYASGCANARRCTVRVREFAGIYGYAHNGGAVGMIKLPLHYGKLFVLAETSVDAQISFFEITPSRRAYCDPLIGENLAGDCRSVKNTVVSFSFEESKEPVRLSPERCEQPQYTVETVPPTDESWGYTVCTCAGCGYSYRDAYVPPAHTYAETRIEPTCTEDGSVTYTCTGCGHRYSEPLPASGHTPGEWTEVRAPQPNEEGLEQRVCTVCGEVLETRPIPVPERIAAERIELSAAGLRLHPDESETLSARVFPQTATEPGVTFESDDPSVAAVSEHGVVTAVAPGTAVITCKSADGAASAVCTVTVSYTFLQWIRHYILFGWTQR